MKQAFEFAQINIFRHQGAKTQSRKTKDARRTLPRQSFATQGYAKHQPAAGSSLRYEKNEIVRVKITVVTEEGAVGEEVKSVESQGG